MKRNRYGAYKSIKLLLKDRRPDRQIFVRNLQSKTITLDVCMSDSLLIIKWLILQRESILSIHQQNLWFAGRLLDDFQTLEAQGVSPESTLHLTARLS
jgi:hypothetical protein